MHESGVSDGLERDAHVIALTDYGDDRWCAEQGEPKEALKCVNVVKPLQIPIGRQPRWQVGVLLQALRTLADSGSPFVVDSDGDRRLVVEAKVELPVTLRSNEYRIQLQSVPGS